MDRENGRQKRRKWLKIRMSIDAKTQGIIAESTTESCTIDSKMTISLLDQVKGGIKAVLIGRQYE